MIVQSKFDIKIKDFEIGQWHLTIFNIVGELSIYVCKNKKYIFVYYTTK